MVMCPVDTYAVNISSIYFINIASLCTFPGIKGRDWIWTNIVTLHIVLFTAAPSTGNPGTRPKYRATSHSFLFLVLKGEQVEFGYIYEKEESEVLEYY